MAEHSSSPAADQTHTSYTIGYAVLPNKHDTFVQPSFIDLAARHGVRLATVDASRPLVEQGPFDLVVHKLYGAPWRAQLEAFSALHPDVPIIDPPAAIERVLDRFTMLDAVAGLPVTKEGSVATPKQITVSGDGAESAASAAGLRFPLIAKPVEVDGSAASHDLCLVYREEGLRGLRAAPVVLQEFVNHGGVLFKVYVVGDHAATCVARSSLPDVTEERLRDPAADAAAPFANISLRPAPGAGEVEMPPQEFVSRVAGELRRALGLNLINFDMIRGRDADGNAKYFILDINYCPGYSKMPGFEPVLLEFFLEKLRRRPVHEQPACPGAGSGIGIGAEASNVGVEPSFIASGAGPKHVQA
ncbi:unnamed protein product [Urochloa humidicola]